MPTLNLCIYTEQNQETDFVFQSIPFSFACLPKGWLSSLCVEYEHRHGALLLPVNIIGMEMNRICDVKCKIILITITKKFLYFSRRIKKFLQNRQSYA